MTNAAMTEVPAKYATEADAYREGYEAPIQTMNPYLALSPRANAKALAWGAGHRQRNSDRMRASIEDG